MQGSIAGPLKLHHMELVIDFGSHRVPLFWDGDLVAGIDIFAVACNFPSVLIAVELLLDDNGLHRLWYGPEVIMEDGVFRVRLTTNDKHWQWWNRSQRLETARKFA